MTLPSLSKILTLAPTFVLALCATTANAQAWPAKPIKWVVPYTPGGITDNATRMVVQKVQEQTGWTILVENRPGV
jgi:tripartite-type tricarboxylate transporter receptor subunit TctC